MTIVRQTFTPTALATTAIATTGASPQTHAQTTTTQATRYVSALGTPKGPDSTDRLNSGVVPPITEHLVV